ncbi:MAG: hypothetical protein ACD_46C00341G0001 [uncultured bacterium]|nr:MAG: hypothetical protein ACD_46C00341G0001 [uncultured bacterium]
MPAALRFAIVILLFILSGSTIASNVSFLDYSATFYFQGQDQAMMLANAMDALNRYPDGKKASWKNPKTGTFGYAIPSNTRNQNGMRCRNLKIFNNAHNVAGEATYTFCKFGKEWKIPG